MDIFWRWWVKDEGWSATARQVVNVIVFIAVFGTIAHILWG